MVFRILDRLKVLKWEEWVVFGAGLFGFLTALFVLIGWYTHNPILIDLSPNLTAMQFNTAVAILLSSLSLISLSLNLTIASQSFSLAGGGIVFLTALEYLFGFDLHIDQFFHTYDLPIPMIHPGRMTFITSIALLLTNLAILSHNYRKLRFLLPISLVLSILVVSLAFTGLIGHITGLEATLGLIDFAKMAIHTTVVCLVLGVSTFIFTLRSSWNEKMGRFTLPTILFIGMATATLALWEIFRAQEHFLIERLTAQKTTSLQTLFNQQLQSDLNTIKRMADRWEAMEGFSQKLWTVDSYNYVRDLTTLNQIAIYNQTLQLQNQSLKGTFVSIPSLESLLPTQISQLKSGTIITAPSPSKECLLVYYPLMINDEFKGLIASSLDLVSLLKEGIKEEYLGNYLVSLSYQDQIIFSGGDLRSPTVGTTIQAEVAHQFGPWQIRMTLTKSAFLSGFKALDAIILATGLIISTLAGGLAFVGLKVRLKNQELKKINELLIDASAKTEAATEAKAIFLASMSHEIRTPLNAIVGTIELLTETEINPIQKKYLDRVVQSSTVLLDLIGDILDYSKIESGGVMLEPIPADLITVMKTVLDNLALKANKKQIDIFVECPAQPLPLLLFDPIRLQQILSNLGNNSYKFTDHGHILFRIIIKATFKTHLLIRFEVIDTGIGISPDDQSKLFQKFSQIEKTQSRKYGGVGLGLSICKKLIDLMKGEIGVNSQLGHGSTFWFEIPFEIASKSLPPPYSIANKSILLLDEKEKEREIIKKYLTAWGAHVFLNQTKEKIDWILSTSFNPEQKNNTILIGDHRGSIEGVERILNRPIFPDELYRCFERKQ